MEREELRRFSAELAEFCKSVEEKYGMEIRVGSIKFGPAKADMSLHLRKVGGMGERVFSESEHGTANRGGLLSGLTFEGNLLGSRWETTTGEVYEVVEHNTRRPRYPLILKSEYGKLSKCGFEFLGACTQLKPSAYEGRASYTYEEFMKWVELDPESDAIHPDDEDLVDAVNAFITMNIEKDMDIVGRFYEVFGEFEKKEDMDTILPQLYETLFIDRDMRGAIIRMNNFKKK